MTAQEANAKTTKETSHLDSIFGYINYMALQGIYACSFDTHQCSANTQEELKRLGYKVTCTDSYFGEYVTVEWDVHEKTPQ